MTLRYTCFLGGLYRISSNNCKTVTIFQQASHTSLKNLSSCSKKNKPTAEEDTALCASIRRFEFVAFIAGHLEVWLCVGLKTRHVQTPATWQGHHWFRRGAGRLFRDKRNDKTRINHSLSFWHVVQGVVLVHQRRIHFRVEPLLTTQVFHSGNENRFLVLAVFGTMKHRGFTSVTR